jgi:hypothetical protein
MHSTQNAVANHEYRSVPITALAESATNPRKRFDPKSLEELAASFKTQGILAPLLVRELEQSKYEVVAGARRLRAGRNSSRFRRRGIPAKALPWDGISMSNWRSRGRRQTAQAASYPRTRSHATR